MAVRLVFAVDGTGNGCLALPITHGTAPLAQLVGQWYVLEDITFEFPFTQLNC